MAYTDPGVREALSMVAILKNPVVYLRAVA